MQSLHVICKQLTNEREGTIAEQNIRTNRRIRVPEVRLIDAAGEQRGIMATHEAMKLAEEAGLDLVEVSPKAQPPVCRLMDMGRYLYLQKQKTAEQKRSAVRQLTKEVKLHPKTDAHDVAFKLNHIRDFLKEGHKVKVTVAFKGREIVHQQFGRNHTDLIAKTVVEEGLGLVESAAMLFGKNLTMLLAPKEKKDHDPRRNQ